LANGWHTNTVVFEDDQEKSANPGNFYQHTNTWSWMAAVYQPRYATNGSLSLRGFDVRMSGVRLQTLPPQMSTWWPTAVFSANVAQFVAWPAIAGTLTAATDQTRWTSLVG